MKRMLMTLAAGLVVCGWASLAETIDTHKTFRPQEIKWVRGRLVYPPERSRPFSMATPKARACSHCGLKCRKDTASLRICMPGRKSLQSSVANSSWDWGKPLITPAWRSFPRKFLVDAQGRGSLCFRRRGFGHSDQRPGPWDIDYVNPKDDPRLNGAPEPPKSQLYSSEHRNPFAGPPSLRSRAGNIARRKRHTDREKRWRKIMRSTKLSVYRAFEKFASGMTTAVRNCLLAAPRAGLAYAP